MWVVYRLLLVLVLVLEVVDEDDGWLLFHVVAGVVGDRIFVEVVKDYLIVIIARLIVSVLLCH